MLGHKMHLVEFRGPSHRPNTLKTRLSWRAKVINHHFFKVSINLTLGYGGLVGPDDGSALKYYYTFWKPRYLEIF